jgi:hypothetical protein
MSLDIACADSCMPMAINHYFQRLIFTSWNEFVERQRLLAGASRIYIQPGHSGDWHFRMMQRVRTARHIYAKKIVFPRAFTGTCLFPFVCRTGTVGRYYDTGCLITLPHTTMSRRWRRMHLEMAFPSWGARGDKHCHSCALALSSTYVDATNHLRMIGIWKFSFIQNKCIFTMKKMFKYFVFWICYMHREAL